MARTILVVEDDRRTHDTIRLYLEREGFQVESCFEGATAAARAREVAPDLVVLDLMLPGRDGLAICRELRQEGKVPIILLTARSTEEDKLQGFELGADDYLTKPFSPRELLARVRAVLRRSHDARHDASHVDAADEEISWEDLVVDRARHEVRIAGRGLALTPTELRLLSTLAKAPHRVFTRAELIAKALGDDAEVFDRTIDAHITNLRRKLRQAGRAELIATVFGAGYRLAPDRDPP